ncbi:MAG TPA: AAA family ATPase [Spirochaetales bacterium]|nr:AAA family ATPase [Spirochaetales bacterium]HRY54618.1 AAA family ATPase [Spirochaetia bacterium]HRZ64439.1 AAA family ATPase [Spirochaetia bacterium]
MTTISVASGKGGAGKTSVAAALAERLGPGCLVADCDVDAANGAIALGSTIRERGPYFAGPGYRIARESCFGCGLCGAVCRFGAVRPDGTRYAIVPELCERCGACLDRCAAKAIETCEKQAGELFVSDTILGIPLVHAELAPGGDTSGKLVAKLRSRARELAEDGGTVIVDSPPGIGCPVIASITGADLVVLVVEASSSGLRDARRIAELARSMRRELVAVLNKAGLAPETEDLARAYLAEAGIPLAGEIPFAPELRSVEERGLTWASARLAGEGGARLEAALRALRGAIDAIRMKKEEGKEKP